MIDGLDVTYSRVHEDCPLRKDHVYLSLMEEARGY